MGWRPRAVKERSSSSSGRDDLRLAASGLSVTYAGGAIGCLGVDLEVPPKSVLAIVGRNGAGKTSLLRGVAGFLPSEGVTVRGVTTVDGARLARHPVKANRAGVVLVPERDKVFPSLTVAEHLRLAGGSSDEDLLGFEAIRDRWTSNAGLLSGGERQMLALTVAWAQHPKLLLVDELSLGLAPIIVRQLLRPGREMVVQADLSVVLVEQDARAALEVADEVVVMDHGEVVWQGLSSETTAEELLSHYLGVAS